MTRRELLAAAAALTPLQAADWKARARANLKLGVFTSIYSAFPVDEAARRIRDDGFAGAILQYDFADVRFDPLKPDWTAAGKITAAFGRAGVKIAALHAYYNVVDPDLDRRRRGEDRMRFLIANWKRVGSPVLCTETGTKNEKSEWSESPANYTEETYQECRAILAGFAKSAEATGAVVAIEAYWRNVIDSAEKTERLFRDVHSPALQLVMDPCNYFRDTDLPHMRPVLEDMFRRVGSRSAIAHAKDVKSTPGGQELPAAGLGVLDYPLYLSLLARLNKPLILAIEHLKLDDVPRARDYVLGQLDKIL